MYDDLGNKVELLRDMVKVTAAQHAEVQAPTIKLIGEIELVGSLKIQGDIDSTGMITNNGKRIDSTHTHSNGGAGVPN
jgi:phage baseplate assembly protein gpV